MNPINRKLIIWGGLMAVVLLVIVVSVMRSPQEPAPTDDLNSPQQIAMDECLAEAAKPLHKVFVETCQKNRSIDKDPENCDRWSSKQILKFMSEQSGYPKFTEALAAWEAASKQCSMPASQTTTPNE